MTLHRDFAGAQAATWYGAALGNQLAGVDLNGPYLPEISMIFNADVDGPAVLGSLGWYYGLDAEPGADIDFVTIALRELGHGLKFFEEAAAGAARACLRHRVRRRNSVGDRRTKRRRHTHDSGRRGPDRRGRGTDGTRVYVANFHDGTLSVIDTRTNRVTATIPVGESATGVAVAPD